MVSTDPYIDPIGIQLWAEETGIASIMYTAWGWPVMEIVHFTGLCLLFGAIGMFDLRMMGAVKGIPLRSLHRLVPFGVLGFVLCAASGFMFVTTEPSQYLYNPAWQSKIGLVLLAGLNMAAFYLSGTARKVRLLGPDEPIPKAARLIAVISLLSWMGVIMFGRVITAFRPPWNWCLWCS